MLADGFLWLVLLVGCVLLMVLFAVGWDIGNKYPPAKITSRKVYFDLWLAIMPMSISLLLLMNIYIFGKMTPISEMSAFIFFLVALILFGVGTWGYWRAERKRKERC